MKEENKKLVMFDFDGVLVNTLDLWFQIHKEANQNSTFEQFSKMSDGNFIDSQQKLKKDGLYVQPTNAEEKYIDGLKFFSISDILHNLILNLSEIYILAIVSSGSKYTISSFLKKEKLEDCFLDICGHEVSKSKVVKINTLVEKYSVNKEHAVYITDTLGDIREANSAGVKSIGVTWGLHNRETLEKGNPLATIDHPMDLFNAIEDVLK